MAGATLLPSITAASLPRVAAAGGRLGRFALDITLVLAVLALYFLARGTAPDRADDAVALSLRLVELEQRLGIFVEPAIQEASVRHFWVKEFANFIYAYLHFPVLAVVGAWLWWRGRERFVLLRNVMFLSMVIGLVFYYALPVAPPRLMAAYGYDFGFVDTVFGGNTAVSYAQPSLIRNDFAAMPSFHFGWIVLASLALWVNTRNRTLRLLAVSLTVVMTWSIVASANHYLVDIAVGGLVIALSWSIVERLNRRESGRAPITEHGRLLALDERRAA
jgi:hypothetical protein